MSRQEFDMKMIALRSKFCEIVTREEYEAHEREVNTLTDEYIAANKATRCTSEQDHAMATLVASWG